MTRAEAMRCWCPFARVSHAQGIRAAVAVNRESDGDGHFACACRAHQCMAWRQDGDDGWCGLAGRSNHQ